MWATRAGADYGWSLLGLVLLANLLKLPFFLYGQRYTAATGESLLEGYRRQGMLFIWIFLAINVLTGMINVAGVAMLSAALFSGYEVTGLSVHQVTVGFLMGCALILIFGRYSLLDAIAKGIIILLALGTAVAVALAAVHASPPPADFVPSAPALWSWAALPFLVMLLGWMPAPIDVSAWSSLWMFSRRDQTGHFASVHESSIDFYLGYLSATVLAALFLGLGAMVMYGSGAHFSSGGIAFSQQLVSLYTETIGSWSRLLILTAAFVTMFSTTLTAMDGYARALAASTSIVFGLERKLFRPLHLCWIVLSVVVGSLIVLFFVGDLLQLLTFAAIVSFLTSPVLATINYRVMRGPNVPTEHRPGLLLTALSWTGLLFLSCMSLVYLYVTFLA